MHHEKNVYILYPYSPLVHLNLELQVFQGSQRHRVHQGCQLLRVVQDCHAYLVHQDLRQNHQIPAAITEL